MMEKVWALFDDINQFNGNPAAEVSLSQGVSVNPLIGTSIPGLKAGDVVSVSWVDNQGGGESAEATVK